MANISSIKLPSGVTYNLKDTVSGYSTTDEKVKVNEVTTGSQYYIMLTASNDGTNASTKNYDTAALKYNPFSSSYCWISIGDTSNKTGALRLYKKGGSYSEIQTNATSSRQIKLPDAAGTLALTSDVPSVPAWALASTKPSYTASEISLTDESTTESQMAENVQAELAILHNVVDGGYFLTEETDPTVPSWAKQSSKPTYTASEVGAIPTTAKGAANGVAPLDTNGLIASAYLPSYVDDVLEYATRAGFPAMGETGKIYVDTDTNKTYRWGGSEYVEISASLALGKTSSTAAPGNHTHSVSITPSTTSVYSITSLGTANTPTQIDTSKFSGGSLTMTINGTDSSQLDITFTAAAPQSGFYTAGTAATMPTRSQVTELWNGYTSATAQAIQ